MGWGILEDWLDPWFFFLEMEPRCPRGFLVFLFCLVGRGVRVPGADADGPSGVYYDMMGKKTLGKVGGKSGYKYESYCTRVVVRVLYSNMVGKVGESTRVGKWGIKKKIAPDS